MANYVLVHGGKSDGHVWSKVFPMLQEHGHHFFCPTLSRPENSGLSDHISEVCSLIENEDILMRGKSKEYPKHIFIVNVANSLKLAK